MLTIRRREECTDEPDTTAYLGQLPLPCRSRHQPSPAPKTPIVWRMATSWTKGLPGPGVSADRLAERITTMSGGRLRVDVFPAGAIVPAFGVFDGVASGAVEMGHTASFFWDGTLPGAAFFTTVPFGLGPLAHQTWIEHRGGQQLWDELYRPRGVRGLLAGNTGPSMGGWFRKPIESSRDAPACASASPAWEATFTPPWARPAEYPAR